MAKENRETMDLDKKYHSKLLLAGEYSVLLGGEALSAPLTKYSAQLRQKNSETDTEKLHMSVESLRNLVSHIQNLPKNSFYGEVHIKELDDLIKQGYYVDSNIPYGYGIGSSAALSALVYDQFFSGQENLEINHVRKDLSTIESIFHGKSSGIDALTSYLDTSIYFHENKIQLISSDILHPAGGYRFFLLDSGVQLETGPLVNLFTEKMRNKVYNDEIRKDYLSLNSKYIRLMLEKNTEKLPLIFNAISDLQWRLFREMIPDNMEEFWMEGQISNTFYLKLNGSGGGYVLGIAHEDSKALVEKMLEPHPLVWI